MKPKLAVLLVSGGLSVAFGVFLVRQGAHAIAAPTNLFTSMCPT